MGIVTNYTFDTFVTFGDNCFLLLAVSGVPFWFLPPEGTGAGVTETLKAFL